MTIACSRTRRSRAADAKHCVGESPSKHCRGSGYCSGWFGGENQLILPNLDIDVLAYEEVGLFEPVALRLSEVRQARWLGRKSLQLGQAAGSSVFWSTDDSTLSILVGHDDETWDFGVMLPLAVLDEILEEVARALT